MLQCNEIRLTVLISIASIFYVPTSVAMPTAVESFYAAEPEVNAAIDQIEKNNTLFTIYDTASNPTYIADYNHWSGKIEFAPNTIEVLINRYKKGHPIKLSLTNVDELRALLADYAKNIISVSHRGLEFPPACKRPLLVFDCTEKVDALSQAEIKVLKAFFIVANSKNYRLQNIFDHLTIKWPTCNLGIKTIIIGTVIGSCIILGVLIYQNLHTQLHPGLTNNQECSPSKGIQAILRMISPFNNR